MDDSTESGDVGVSKTRKKSGIVTISLRESFPCGEALSSILYKHLYAPAGSAVVGENKRDFPQMGNKKIKIIYYKNRACIFNESVVFYMSCGMIALKREVAAHCGRFSVERMSS